MVFNRFADGVVVQNWGLHDHSNVLVATVRRVVGATLAHNFDAAHRQPAAGRELPGVRLNFEPAWPGSPPTSRKYMANWRGSGGLTATPPAVGGGSPDAGRDAPGPPGSTT